MSDSDQSKKRRLKDAETFRQRALKAAEERSQPKRDSKFQLITRPLKATFRPVAAAYRKLRSIKQLKPVFKVLDFIGRLVFPKYFRTSFEELKKVTWPSFKQSRKLTYAVLIFAIIFGTLVAIVDWGLGKLFKHLLLK